MTSRGLNVLSIQSVQFSVETLKYNVPMAWTQGGVIVRTYAYQKEKIRMEICVPEIARQYVQNHNYAVKVTFCPTVATVPIRALNEERIKMDGHVWVFVLQRALRGSLYFLGQLIIEGVNCRLHVKVSCNY